MAPIDRKTIAESKRLRRRHTCGGLCEKPNIISNFSTAKRAIPSLCEVLPVFDPAFTRCWQLQVGCKASTTQFTFSVDILERDISLQGGLVRYERGSRRYQSSRGGCERQAATERCVHGCPCLLNS